MRQLTLWLGAVTGNARASAGNSAAGGIHSSRRVCVCTTHSGCACVVSWVGRTLASFRPHTWSQMTYTLARRGAFRVCLVEVVHAVRSPKLQWCAATGYDTSGRLVLYLLHLTLDSDSMCR